MELRAGKNVGLNLVLRFLQDHPPEPVPQQEDLTKTQICYLGDISIPGV